MYALGRSSDLFRFFTPSQLLASGKVCKKLFIPLGESLMGNPLGRNLQQQALFWIFTKFPFHSFVANVQSERLCGCKNNTNF